MQVDIEYCNLGSRKFMIIESKTSAHIVVAINDNLPKHEQDEILQDIFKILGLSKVKNC
jgi:hypothetical protein